MNRIIARDISKSFAVGVPKDSSVLERVLTFVSGRQPYNMRAALMNVSLRAEAGEVVGIIGRNGSGKSTLLRIIAGILHPDKGFVETHGRLVPLIHLDTGVRPRLTMRENIYLVGAFLGLPPATMRTRLEQIVSYAGLAEYIDTKWYQFSDGMKQKAVFSIGIHTDPDILLLDEAFSAGDETFKRQSSATIRELAAAGTTTLLVGHNLRGIEECADRVVWMEDGKVLREGQPTELISDYRDHA